MRLNEALIITAIIKRFHTKDDCHLILIAKKPMQNICIIYSCNM